MSRLTAQIPAGRRSGPATLVRELELTANTSEDLLEILRSIATGRHQLTVFDAYEIGQSICLSVGGTGDSQGLRLRALVVQSDRTAIPGYDWAYLYQVTVELEHPLDAVVAMVDRVEAQLRYAQQSSELDGLLMPSALVDPTVEVQPPDDSPPSVSASKAHSITSGRVVATKARCALEETHPEVLNLLTSAWGDSELFQAVIQSLLIGDRCLPGGWAPELWSELTFLQDLHALAHGVPPHRKLFQS